MLWMLPSDLQGIENKLQFLGWLQTCQSHSPGIETAQNLQSLGAEYQRGTLCMTWRHQMPNFQPHMSYIEQLRRSQMRNPKGTASNHRPK
jgi:hypothetical protein